MSMLPQRTDSTVSREASINDALPQPELIANYACETGENPLWHPTERQLYWSDIPAGRLFRYAPSIGKHEECYQGRPVGGFTIQADGSLLLFMDRGTIALWRNGLLTEIVSEIPAEQESRFNDVIADPHGRVFCGTMSTDKSNGRLYRLDLDGSLVLLLEDVGCSNGMAFTLDHKGFYYTDSIAREIYFFNYNIKDGSISNRRIFARFDEADGMPDGATLDSKGRLWSALWNGASIVRLHDDGSIVERISFPAQKVSSLTFAGDDYTDIYITTAGGNSPPVGDTAAGALFRVKVETAGLPEFFSRIEAPISASSKREG
jgi:sugar lactone lactonase YvrE